MPGRSVIILGPEASGCGTVEPAGLGVVGVIAYPVRSGTPAAARPLNLGRSARVAAVTGPPGRRRKAAARSPAA